MSCESGEHNGIVDYLAEAGGRAYFEVPVAGPRVAASHRYIDAVRIADPAGKGTCTDYNKHSTAFEADLEAAHAEGWDVELLEAKNKLNRSVIGQVIIAGDLFCDQFTTYGPIRLAVVVGAEDAALRKVCDRRGIGVHLIKPWRGKAWRAANRRGSE